MRTGSAIDLALRCYPGWWQQRYADEVRVVSNDLTADGRSTSRVALDLLGGALVARSSARGMPKNFGLWSARTRASVSVATLPWLLIAPLVMASVDSVSFHSTAGPVFWTGFSMFPSKLQLIINAQPVPAPALTPAGHVILYSALTITVLFLISFIVLISGWSGLARGIRKSDSPHRRLLRLFVWAPVFALLADLVLLIAQGAARRNSFTHGGDHVVASGGNPAVLHVLNDIVPVVAAVGWLVSIACVAMAVRHADIGPTELRFGKSVAAVVATLFALLMAAYATWGIALIVQTQEQVSGHFTSIDFARSGLRIPVMLSLVVAVCLSLAGARAARNSWKTLLVL